MHELHHKIHYLHVWPEIIIFNQENILNILILNDTCPQWNPNETISRNFVLEEKRKEITQGMHVVNWLEGKMHLQVNKMYNTKLLKLLFNVFIRAHNKVFVTTLLHSVFGISEWVFWYIIII